MPAVTDGPVRVLVEVESLDRGGLEETVMSLVSRWDPSRIHPVVACVEAGGQVADRLGELGVEVRLLDGNAESYESLLREHAVEVVNSHYSVFGAGAARRSAIPNVHVVQNTYVWLGRSEVRRLTRRFRSVDHFVAVSTGVRSYTAAKFSVPAEGISVIPNAADIERLMSPGPPPDRRRIRGELGLAEDATVFLMVGALEPRKGHSALLSAFARVSARHPHAQLVCLGPVVDVGFAKRCRQQIADLGLETRVKLVEQYAHGVGDFYRASDAFVLASVFEGFSLATLEAAAFGLPLILTDVGGARDLAEDGVATVLVPPQVPALDRVELRALFQVYKHPPENVVAALDRAMGEMCEGMSGWHAAAAAGPELVRAKYGASVIARRYEDLLVRTARPAT